MSTETMMTSIFEQLGEQKRHVRELALERIGERAKMMLFTSNADPKENTEKLKKISKRADQMLLGTVEFDVADLRLDINQLMEGMDKSILQRLVDMI